MNCSREWIEGYLDDELDSSLRAEAQEHMAHCAACSETYHRLQQQRAEIRLMVPIVPAPAVLRRSVQESLQAVIREAAAETRNARWRGAAIAAIAASLLLALSLAWNFTRPSPTAERGLVAQNILDSHIRSLVGTHLMDVPSSDQHTVKPWFDGKLDFSPKVPDLASDGFPLVGGRLDYVDGRNVAAIVYRRRQHVVNVFTWPSAVPDRASESSERGYAMVHWSESGMTYWAVADIPPAELRQFASLYRAK